VRSRAAAACVAALTLAGFARASGEVGRRAAQPEHRVATDNISPPPRHARFSYQLGGAFSPERGVTIVDRDRMARPVAGLYNVCYVNAFQAQPEERRWWLTRHRDLLLFRHGHAVIDAQWNEQLLDTSTAAKRRALARIVGGWIAGCAHDGFQAIEPDNLDSWTRSRRALIAGDNLALAALLIARAHSLGLAIAQKNAAEIAPKGRHIGFDFAIAEECQPYAECGAYTHSYGREVIEIEYPDNGGPANFVAACRARGDRITIVYRDRDVTPAGRPGYIERSCPRATSSLR
jgi:Glycoside-hydrolase family GH114